MRYLQILLLWHGIVMAAQAQSPNAALTATLAAHGGAAVQSVKTIELRGTVVSQDRAPASVVITASLEGQLRVDYGVPVQRTIITTEKGRAEWRGTEAIPKPPHVGLFSALDMLSLLGIRRLTDPKVQLSSLGAGTVRNRATARIKGVTEQEQTFYGRKVADETDVDIDSATGLVARISRVQYAEQSLDRPFLLSHEFADYRQVQGILFPFRIDSLIDNRTVDTLTVTSVTVNPALPPTTWEKR